VHPDWKPKSEEVIQTIVDDVCDMISYQYLRPIVERAVRMIKETP